MVRCKGRGSIGNDDGGNRVEKYLNASVPIHERVEDLLERMTLREKVGQLNQRLLGWRAYVKRGDHRYELTDEFKREVERWGGLGVLYGVFRADPWSGVTWQSGIAPEDSRQVTEHMQSYVTRHSRLHIPVLFSEECPHGHQALGSTIFPSNLGMASSWNPALYQAVFHEVAQELRARGGHLGLVSTLDLLRDPRWGRCEETTGEDPYLAARYTEAAVWGFEDLKPAEGSAGPGASRVTAVLKHFCAQGEASGGLNMGAASIGPRELREIHLPPMHAGVKAGARAVMAAYNEIDGIPCVANAHLLNTILRQEWGFSGIVMGDGGAVDQLQALTGSLGQAARLALESGVDVSLWDEAFTTLEERVAEEGIVKQWVDQAVRRVLRLKFTLGLFDPEDFEPGGAIRIHRDQAQSLNREMARQSLVLLKNDHDLLPLNRAGLRLAVIGPNANSVYNQLGDYTPPQGAGMTTTLVEGLVEVMGTNGTVRWARGCGIRDHSTAGFEEALVLAAEADVIVAAVGGSSARDFGTVFDSHGAAQATVNANDMDAGEGVDVAHLSLGGEQENLIKALLKTGKPVVAVLIQGRPYAIEFLAEHCQAILCAWYPGQEGGRAIAEILLGEAAPSGRLPVSIPRSSAQLPVYYNRKDTGGVERGYRDGSARALYPFGFGLTYTTFCYEGIEVSCQEISCQRILAGATIQLSIAITNVGPRAGVAVAQVYVIRETSRVVRRRRELKGFERIALNPGETRRVRFDLGREALEIWGIDNQWTVEPSVVRLAVGSDSETLETRQVTLLA